MGKDRLITLAIHTYPKALILKGVLESHGISVAIQNVNLLKPVISPGVRVRIQEADLPHALEILENDPIFSSKVAEALPQPRVLIPIDFSDYSMQACRLGFDFAKVHRADVVLLLTFLPPQSTGKLSLSEAISYEIKEGEGYKQFFAEANREMTLFCEKLQQLIDAGEIPSISYISRVCEGVPEDTILLLAKELSPILIVMGSRGKSRKEVDLIGSVTAEVIDSGQYPVFAIPEGFAHLHMNEVRNVAFFTNIDQQDLISLDMFMRLFGSFPFGIYFFHLSDDSNRWDEVKLSGLSEYVQSHYAGRESNYTILNEDNYLDNVEKLVHELKVDVLVIPTRKRNILARLFSPGMARKMLFHTETPLIVIHI